MGRTATAEPEEYYTGLRDAFVRHLPRYFNGHERVGVSLTGGLDTRIIMAWHKAAPGSLPCYTFGSMYRDNQDVHLARKVAKICGQTHQVITTGDEFLSRFPHYAERSTYLTDATVDLGRSPDLYVNEKAREIAPVRIVGTYGSEMLMRPSCSKPLSPRGNLSDRKFCRRFAAAKRLTMRSAGATRLRSSLSASRRGTTTACFVWSRPRWQSGRRIWTMMWSRRCIKLPLPYVQQGKPGCGWSARGTPP